MKKNKFNYICIVFIFFMACDFDTKKSGNIYSNSINQSKSSKYFSKYISLSKNNFIINADTVLILESWMEIQKFYLNQKVIVNNHHHDIILKTNIMNIDSIMRIKIRDGLTYEFSDKNIIISEINDNIFKSDVKIYIYDNLEILNIPLDSIIVKSY